MIDRIIKFIGFSLFYIPGLAGLVTIWTSSSSLTGKLFKSALVVIVYLLIMRWLQKQADPKRVAQTKPGLGQPLANALNTAATKQDDNKSDYDLAEDVYMSAYELTKQHNGISTEILQKELRIRYRVADKVVDLLESRGVIAPYDGDLMRKRI